MTKTTRTTRRALILGSTMGLFDLLANKKPAQAAPAAKAAAAAHIPQGAVAQLVAGNVISPLRNIGYPADWFLAQLLALKPQSKPPKAFRAPVVATKLSTPAKFAERYMMYLTESYSLPVSFYDQEVQGYHMFLWNGVRMNGLQVVTAFNDTVTSEEARKIWWTAYGSYGTNSKPNLTYAPGRSGWAAWEAALQLIAAPEANAIWLTSSDATSFPQYKQPNESGVQLILGHPAYDSGRKPLAYFTAAAAVRVEDLPRPRRPALALQMAMQQALDSAGLKPSDIGTIVRDSGMGTKEANARLATVGEAMQALFPKVDLLDDTIDLASTLGDLGASTVNYSLLIGAFACHERKHPVLYISTRDPGVGRALVILPSPEYSETDVVRCNRDADYGKYYNRPWWGQRKDGKPEY